MKQETCLNCGHIVRDHYCGHCGQDAHTKRLNWHYIWHEIPHSVFHLDKGLIPTLWGMLVRPSKVVNEFLDGKRVRYYRPLAFLILLGTIASIINLNVPLYKVLSQNAETAAFTDTFQRISGKYYNLITIAMIPIFSFTTWLFYRKERNYVEIATAHFYIQGAMAFLSVFGLFYFLDLSKESFLMVAAMLTTISLLYQTWVYATIFKTRKRVARIFIALSIVTLNYLLISLIILGITIFLFVYVYHIDSIEINFGS